MMIEERKRVDHATLARHRSGPALGRAEDGGQCRRLRDLQRDQPPNPEEGGSTTPVLVHGRKEAFRDRVALRRTRDGTAFLRSPGAASPGRLG